MADFLTDEASNLTTFQFDSLERTIKVRFDYQGGIYSKPSCETFKFTLKELIDMGVIDLSKLPLKKRKYINPLSPFLASNY
jgi:hypothetical protein